MADEIKVYAIKFDTRTSQRALKKLDEGLVKLERRTNAAGEKFKREFAGAARSAGTLNRKLATTRISLDKIRGGLNKVSRKLTIATAAFAGLGAVSVKNALELNKGMANVSTLLSGGTEQVVKLKKEVQDLAIESGKGTGDLSEGLYEVVSALGESTENMDQLRQSSKAAIAGRSSTLGAVKMLSAVTKGYGDTSAEAMGKVSDLAFMTVKLGQTTFPELASSIGGVIPLAAAMNTSQEELFGTLATLTGVTGDTSEVVTQLASVYSSFMKPSKELTKLAKEQGFASASAMLKAKGLAETMKILGKETKGEADQVAKFMKRKEAQIAVLALTGGQADTYNEKLAAMAKWAGSTDEAFRKQTQGINEQGHSWDQTKQRLVVFSQRLGDKLIPVIDRLLKKFEPLLKYLEDLDDETIDAWLAMGKWVAIMAVATKALSGFLGIVQTLGSLKALNAGLAGTASSLGGIGAQAATATTKLSGLLSKLGAVAGAAGAGVMVGTALHETVVDPRMKRGFRVREESTGVGAVGGQLTIEEREKEIEKIDQAIARVSKESKEFSFANVFGTAIGGLTGEKTTAGLGLERRMLLEEKKTRHLTALAGQKARADLGLETVPATYDAQPRPESSIVIGDTNLTINANGGNAEEIARKTSRELDKRDRANREAIRRAARETAPAEL